MLFPPTTQMLFPPTQPTTLNLSSFKWSPHPIPVTLQPNFSPNSKFPNFDNFHNGARVGSTDISNAKFEPCGKLPHALQTAEFSVQICHISDPIYILVISSLVLNDLDLLRLPQGSSFSANEIKFWSREVPVLSL